MEAYKIERIPTESEKAASAIEQVTATLSTVVEQMQAMNSQLSAFGERVGRLEEQFK